MGPFQIYLSQTHCEEENGVWEGSGRQTLKEAVLVMLTACDCGEQVEILSRGNREVSIRIWQGRPEMSAALYQASV